MTARIAIGVGCRRGCSADLIEALVRQALLPLSDADALGIFTIDDKAGEPGLTAAADHLGLNLRFLTRETLRAQAPFIQTRSRQSERLFGVASVAEAAALAGAGQAAVLIVARIANQSATCAIASASPANKS